MGSLLDTIECPNCGQEATSDFYYKTGEEIVLCMYCGYHKSVTIKDANKRLDEVEEDDWQIVEIKKPYGAYRIKYKDYAVEECGTLIAYEDFKILKDKVDENKDDVESFVISRYKDGEIIIKSIIGNEKES
jgi:Zn ribbon nucleic-acid-binding protein